MKGPGRTENQKHRTDFVFQKQNKQELYHVCKRLNKRKELSSPAWRNSPPGVLLASAYRTQSLGQPLSS